MRGSADHQAVFRPAPTSNNDLWGKTARFPIAAGVAPQLRFPPAVDSALARALPSADGGDSITSLWSFFLQGRASTWAWS